MIPYNRQHFAVLKSSGKNVKNKWKKFECVSMAKPPRIIKIFFLKKSISKYTLTLANTPYLARVIAKNYTYETC